jgi:hypothetical protein
MNIVCIQIDRFENEFSYIQGNLLMFVDRSIIGDCDQRTVGYIWTYLSVLVPVSSIFSFNKQITCLSFMGTRPAPLAQDNSNSKEGDVGSIELLFKGRIFCTRDIKETSFNSI